MWEIQAGFYKHEPSDHSAHKACQCDGFLSTQTAIHSGYNVHQHHGQNILLGCGYTGSSPFLFNNTPTSCHCFFQRSLISDAVWSTDLTAYMLQSTDEHWRAFRCSILERTPKFCPHCHHKCAHTIPFYPLQMATRSDERVRGPQSPTQHGSFDDGDITDKQLVLGVQAIEAAASAHPQSPAQHDSFDDGDITDEQLMLGVQAIEAAASAHPQPVHPEHVHPDPVHPEPGHPEPGHPEPSHPEPGHPEPGHPEPSHPEPGHPEAGHPQQSDASEPEGCGADIVQRARESTGADSPPDVDLLDLDLQQLLSMVSTVSKSVPLKNRVSPNSPNICV
jgi:hypothetical protein